MSVAMKLALVAATRVSQAHSHGLELEHRHGQGAWPLTLANDRGFAGDAALIGQAAAMLPGAATWGWEDSEQHWAYGLLRTMDVEAQDALVHHMLHHHGLAALIASHADGFDAFLHGFVPDGADAADVGAAALTRAAKELVLAEQAFPAIRDLRAKLNEMSLSGLRNLHSYDHGAEWRCMGIFGDSDGYLQAMASDRARMWVGAKMPSDVRAAVNREYRDLRVEIDQRAELKDGRGRHVAAQFLQLRRMGAFAQTEEWQHTAFDFHLMRRDGKCFAEGSIEWEELDEASEFSVELSDDECEAVGAQSTSAAAARVSAHVRAWVDGAVAAHRAALGARRGTVWADEEAAFAAHAGLAAQPRRASTCAPYRPTPQDVMGLAHQIAMQGEPGMLFTLQMDPFAMDRIIDSLHQRALDGSLIETANATAVLSMAGVGSSDVQGTAGPSRRVEQAEGTGKRVTRLVRSTES